MNGCVEKSIDGRCRNSGEPGMGDMNLMVKPSVLKDKTPMCLVNELARYNRIQHQYKLTREEGPLHKRKFTVTLKLGDSEYEAQGSSIKKAQHEAAAIALRNTKYEHPPPKLLPNNRVHTTPTVELNAMAMKRGEPTIYTPLSQPISSYFHSPPYAVGYYARNMYQTRTMFSNYGYGEYTHSIMNSYSYARNHYNNMPYKCPLPYKISLKVGDREYIAEGVSAQAARHNAARKALDDLRNLPEAQDTGSCCSQVSDSTENNKSPISSVYEKAFQYDFQATFEVIDEKGPPHMRTFITECRVGEFRAVGEGNGKKLSKKRAAEKMLRFLGYLPAPPPKSVNNDDRKRMNKKFSYSHRRKHMIHKNKSSEDNSLKESAEINPTTKLMEYQKKRHAKEPVYVLVEEEGRGRKKQFSIQVKMNDLSYIGNGSNKKDAKKQASIGMLKLLGLDVDQTATAESTNSIHVGNEMPTSMEKVEKTGKKTSSSPVNGKQIAPGILLVSHAVVTSKSDSNDHTLPEKDFSLMNGTSTYSEKENTPYYGNENIQCFNNLSIQKNLAKDQLIQLADKFGYEVQIANFPKGHHHKEYLSLITLNTNPSQTCYGSGNSTEDAQNEAAFNALSMISEMGIENLFTNNKVSTYVPEKEIVS